MTPSRHWISGLAALLTAVGTTQAEPTNTPSGSASALPASAAGAALPHATALRADAAEAARGWLGWRGPTQNGVSTEPTFPGILEVDGTNFLWSAELFSGGSPVVAEGRVFVWGYTSEGPEAREALVAFDADSGKELWRRLENDFLSDAVYNRYAIGAPVVDAATRRIYWVTTAGLLSCVSWDGALLWQRSMMEEYGWLTFPNGRTGSPAIDGDLVIIHGITANWGTGGPARDRFYAFDKRSGDLVWWSEPGLAPKDSSYATPVFGWAGARRVLYAGTGCGHVVCIDARTGEALWRFPMSTGGVNASCVLAAPDTLIAIHGKENLDASTTGRIVALRVPTNLPVTATYPLTLGVTNELWRAPLEHFSSSPVVVDGRIYQVVTTGELVALNLNDGSEAWRIKLNPDQLHASPAYGDGKLFVPMFDGKMFVVEPQAEQGRILSVAELEGPNLGAPALAGGRIYVATKKKVYAFGPQTSGTLPAWPEPAELRGAAGPATALRAVPAEFAIVPGEQKGFIVHQIDDAGRDAGTVADATWRRFIPPTARVKAQADATFTSNNVLVAAADAKMSAGAFMVTNNGLFGVIRGRVLPALPYTEDFESFDLNQETAGERWSYPPLPWLGARVRWQVIEREGNQVLANTLDNILFQRSMTFIGSPGQSNYTVTADVMSDGNRRTLSNVGVINQRYIIALIGNWQILEVWSNHDRVKASVPFPLKANSWIRLKTRVDVDPSGAGVVRAKAWPRDEPEPEAWTIEVPHAVAHTHGAPGVFAFSPQSLKRVFIDNLSIVPNP